MLAWICKTCFHKNDDLPTETYGPRCETCKTEFAPQDCEVINFCNYPGCVGPRPAAPASHLGYCMFHELFVSNEEVKFKDLAGAYLTC